MFTICKGNNFVLGITLKFRDDVQKYNQPFQTNKILAGDIRSYFTENSIATKIENFEEDEYSDLGPKHVRFRQEGKESIKFNFLVFSDISGQ